MRKKSIVVKFRLDEVSFLVLKNKAHFNKMNVSEYLRRLVYQDLNRKPEPEEDNIIEDDFSYKKPKELKLNYIM